MRINPWVRVAVTAATVVVVLVLTGIWRFLDSHGVFTSVEAVSPGTCRTIAGVEGPGAIAIDAVDKITFIAAAARRPTPQDGLYALAYDRAGARPAKIGGLPRDFHPIALSLHRDADGATLMAINRRSTGDYAVDVFAVAVQGGTLKLTEVGAVTGDVLIDPSDVLALDRTRFYLVNRHTSRSKVGLWLDDTFALPRAGILYFDGMKFVDVAKRLVAPSGLALSPDGGRLYVSENLGRALVTFERNPFTSRLENPTSLAIPSGLEKMSVGTDGSLWIAAQPKAFAVAAFRHDGSSPAPSQVFRVALQYGKPQSASLIYSGYEIGAATSAAMADGHLLIGSNLDAVMLNCALQAAPVAARRAGP